MSKPKQINTRDLLIAFDVLELLQEPRKKITYRLVRRERQVQDQNEQCKRSHYQPMHGFCCLCKLSVLKRKRKNKIEGQNLNQTPRSQGL